MREDIIIRGAALEPLDSPTELDRRIAWLGMVTDILQEKGWCYDAKEFTESIANVLATKSKIDAALRDTLTTELIYTRVKSIVDECIPEREKKIEIMSKVCVWLDNLVVEKLSQAGK